MADDADRAGELQQLSDSAVIATQLSRHDFNAKSLTVCKDCGFEIEPERQALGGVTRCRECQGYAEQEGKQWAR
ncbi:TraR/DksA C4-type zinc finger protein [Gilvimarinus japonicus]|uniref:TraR/DksA C4-type zinc finger protein n=1 Tax=Gilvimarinus japonicus TaxID=1796469 RepID=A0ABV7HV64_9GAMM